jgi:putative FmdB family regulatory protein
MPTYVYQCECGYSQDVLHAMSAKVAIVCPICGTDMTKRPSFGTATFNGAGFYRNDRHR